MHSAGNNLWEMFLNKNENKKQFKKLPYNLSWSAAAVSLNKSRSVVYFLLHNWIEIILLRDLLFILYGDLNILCIQIAWAIKKLAWMKEYYKQILLANFILNFGCQDITVILYAVWGHEDICQKKFLQIWFMYFFQI